MRSAAIALIVMQLLLIDHNCYGRSLSSAGSSSNEEAVEAANGLTGPPSLPKFPESLRNPHAAEVRFAIYVNEVTVVPKV